MKGRLSLRFRLLLFGLLPAVLILTGTAAAQGGTLDFNSGVSGNLSAAAPSAFFTFNGTGDDLVMVYALPTSPGLQLSLTVLGPTGPLAFNNNDTTTLIQGDSSIVARLPQSGAYQILVTSTNNAEGSFVVFLYKQDTSPPVELVRDEVAAVDFLPGGLPQAFTFTTDAANPTVLTIYNPDLTFRYTAVIIDQAGLVVATLNGSAQTTSLNFDPGMATYEVIVTPTDPDVQGILTFSVGLAPQIELPQPLATEEIGAPPPSDVCTVTPANNTVNIRSGAGEGFNVIGQLAVGSFAEATGITGNDWYRIVHVGGEGYVAGFVVVTNGPCTTLPTISAPPPVTTEEVGAPTAPPGQPTSTPTATATLEAGQPTATLVEATPTASATYTPTVPPPAPTAPPDANFNDPLTIPLDSTASVTDFVSYPGGDQQDRVRYSISGMNPNSALSGGRADLTITVSCFGTGTENVEFFTEGQTFGCGQTIVQKEVTADSDTGTITITAVGGSSTYVQWVITGTATRVN